MSILKEIKSAFILSPVLRNVLLVVFTIALAFNWFLPYFDCAGGCFDESMLLVYPELILRGKLPYFDFSTFYGPANLWVLAGAYKILGISIFSERIVGLTYRCIYLLALGWMGRRIAPGLSWLFVIAGLLTASYLNLDAFGWIPGCTLALVSILLGLANKGQNAAHGYLKLESGIAAGLALLFRPDLGPALILCSLPALIPSSWKERKIWLVGAFIGLIPLIVLAWKTSLQAIWLNLFYLPVIISNPGRKIPLHTLNSSVLILVSFSLLVTACNFITATLVFLEE